MAGLLHDLGKIPLNKQFPREHVRAVEMTKLGQGPLHQAEHITFGFDHCLVGKMIAEKWRLGESLVEVLSHHHDLEAAKIEHRQFIALVALANIYANVFGIGSSGNPYPDDTFLTRLIEEVGIERSTLSGLRETVVEDIEKAKIFLQIAKRS